MESNRNEDGTFARGNPGGPGRPPRWDRELRRAATEAITTEHVSAIMRRALRMALEGNLSAMKFVIETACGRPVEAEQPPEPLDFKLPALNTAADCGAAITRVLEGACAGTLADAKTKLLLDAVATRMRSIELRDLERRLAELERGAASVELPGSKIRGGY